MTVVVLVTVFMLVGKVVPAPLKNITTSDAGQLRNVIITSFGEMPYEPMESGYYQSDVIPVDNFDKEIGQQTMDVALRTGILVEDPNDKKTTKTEDTIDDISSKDDTAATNVKREAQRGNGQTRGRSQNRPQSRLEYRTPNSYRTPQDTFYSNRYSRNDRYQLPNKLSKHMHYRPYPYPTHSQSDSNTDYYAELGAGWNLQDAKNLLNGRNYNILVVTPKQFPKNQPEPHLRESPPPVYLPLAQRPMLYSVPNVEYHPGLYQHRAVPYPFFYSEGLNSDEEE